MIGVGWVIGIRLGKLCRLNGDAAFNHFATRSFDAQSSLIEIKNQLIANRIDLNVALGGDFNQPSTEAEQ